MMTHEICYLHDKDGNLCLIIMKISEYETFCTSIELKDNAAFIVWIIIKSRKVLRKHSVHGEIAALAFLKLNGDENCPFIDAPSRTTNKPYI